MSVLVLYKNAMKGKLSSVLCVLVQLEQYYFRTFYLKCQIKNDVIRNN